MDNVVRGLIRVRGFQDEEMDFQLIRQLGSASYGAASAGEVLALVSRMQDETPACWVKEFTALAQWQLKDGEERFAAGHVVSALNQWFKACNSFRAAEYYTSCHDATHAWLGQQAQICFLKAMPFVSHTFESLTITYKGKSYPAYYMRPDNTGNKRKTLLIVSGFDGTLEEEYFMRGRAALERGYNVLFFTGPGQMDVFRVQTETHFEPDFENVVKNVVDVALQQPTVDPQQLALMGISFGGYFVTRAAAYEPRIKALIANSPIVDLRGYLLAFQSTDPADLPDAEDFTRDEIKLIPDAVLPPALKELCDALIMRFGQKTFKQTFEYLRKFIVGDAIASIRCPSLALVGQGESKEALRQFNVFCKGISGPLTTHEFTDFEGAGTHCQVGNPSYANAVALDWLDDIFLS